MLKRDFPGGGFLLSDLGKGRGCWRKEVVLYDRRLEAWIRAGNAKPF